MVVLLGGRRIGRVGGLAALLIATLLLGLATSTPRDEYELKAAFVLNFASLVHWPDSALQEATTLDVAVMADTDPYALIERGLDGRSAGGHPVRSRRAVSLDQLDGAHIVFVTRASGVDAADVVSATRGKSVLLIGESRDFARQGGTINFYTEHRRVRFEVNPEAAKEAGLWISSRLLSVARILEN